MKTSIQNIDPDIFEAHMPALARELCSYIGLKATIALVSEFGGQRLHFYAGTSREKIVPYIGEEAAGLLLERYRCVPLSIPYCNKAIKMTYYKFVKERFDELTMKNRYSSLKAIREICRESDRNVCERTIWRILKT